MKVLRTIAIAVCASLFSCSVNRPSLADAGADGSESKEADSIRIDDNTSRDLGISVVKVAELPAGTPVLATGQLQINEDASWQVGAITDGKIVSVPVRVGDFVREGQPLAFLHSHDVHDARATYRQALAELAKQKAVADQARAVRDRTRRLFELRAASKQQLDAAETEYLSATTAVSIAQAEVDKARFHLTDFLEVPAEEPPRTEHNRTADALTIKSPASGTVMERRATVGTVVSTGDLVFLIADLSSLWLIAAVNEADLSRIHPGQRVAVSVRAYPDRKFFGRVLRLGERLDPQTRTLQVRILVPNPHGLLKPDMFANAEFETDTSRMMQIPESAVQKVNGKQVVFVKESPGVFRQREVRLGSKSGNWIQVTSGLERGDEVVVDGAFLLKSQLMKGSGE